MKTILSSALALGAMTSLALANEPVKALDARTGPVGLSDAQMDAVTAGHHRTDHVAGLVVVRIGDVDVEIRQVQVGVAALGAAVIQEQ